MQATVGLKRGSEDLVLVKLVGFFFVPVIYDSVLELIMTGLLLQYFKAKNKMGDCAIICIA